MRTGIALLGLGMFAACVTTARTSSGQTGSPPPPREASPKQNAQTRNPGVYAGASFEASAGKYFGSTTLGQPHNGRFEPLRGAPPLFPAKTKPFPRTEFKGEFRVITDERELKASASAWGIGAAVSDARKGTYAVYRAYEITGCETVRDEGGLLAEPPASARWYPRSACYGRHFEAFFSTQEENVGAKLEASFAVWGASLESFRKKHRLQLKLLAKGFGREETCRKFIFEDPASFEDCFGGLPPPAQTPILVEWVELPRQAKRRRKRERSARKAAARPCAKWRFTRATYSPPKKGLEIRITLTRPDGARRTYRGAFIDLTSDPILAKPGDTIAYAVEDVDLFFDDKLGSGKVEVLGRHPEGQAVDGRITLQGECAARRPPSRKRGKR